MEHLLMLIPLAILAAAAFLFVPSRETVAERARLVLARLKSGEQEENIRAELRIPKSEFSGELGTRDLSADDYHNQDPDFLAKWQADQFRIGTADLK